MFYFIFGYAETALVESVAISSSNLTGIIATSAPSAAGTPPAVAGTLFWNAYDTANGNYFTYDSKKHLVIVNADGAADVIVTVKTVDDTINGLDRVVEDIIVNLAAGETWFSGLLPAIVNDATKVKISIAEDGGTARDLTFLAVYKAT